MQIKSTIFALCTGLSVGLAGGPLGAAQAADNGAAMELPLDELRAFSEVYARIKQDYVEEVDDKTLLEYAVRGMLKGLDPHSNYLDVSQYSDLQASTNGEFGGLGIEVGLEDGFVKVIAPIDDTPAHRAGIKAGDLITRLGDRSVKGMSLSEAVDLMRGEPGSELQVTLLRSGEDKPLTLTLTRDIIQVTSVRGHTLEQGIGYVRLSQFQARTADDMVKLLEKLKAENDGSLDGLVLDLRNNPGGVVKAAVGVADAFLTNGKIVYTDGRAERRSNTWHAEPDDLLAGAPIVVLVNEGSASASEIVAGALQDHKRAIIMGKTTFGKGSVQTIMPLRDGGAVKITTARYFTPNGRSIQAAGIEPDVLLPDVTITAVDSEASKRVKEADLAGHLSNPTEVAAKSGKVKAEIGDDYALSEALNLLRGLRIVAAAKNEAI